MHDMKWKKFLNKQRCQAEGVYVCRPLPARSASITRPGSERKTERPRRDVCQGWQVMAGHAPAWRSVARGRAGMPRVNVWTMPLPVNPGQAGSQQAPVIPAQAGIQPDIKAVGLGLARRRHSPTSRNGRRCSHILPHIDTWSRSGRRQHVLTDSGIEIPEHSFEKLPGGCWHAARRT